MADEALKFKFVSTLNGLGGKAGNLRLRKELALDESAYDELRDALVADGLIGKGSGRGGSVFLTTTRAVGDDEEEEEAESDAADLDEDDEEEATEGADDETDADEPFELSAPQTPAPAAKKARKKAKRAKSDSGPKPITSYRHGDKRVNNPEVGMVHPENDPDQPRQTYAYDPHLDPALMFDSADARVKSLIEDALASSDPNAMRDALEELRKMQAPHLNWAGKAERTSFEVDTVSLHVHERIDPLSIIANARKRAKGEKKEAAFQQADLFAAPFENLPLRQALDFYRHEKGWSNRLVAGDSLLVMNSLLQKESMAGKVQMIYIDPPYGIKYGSNFQPFTNKRDVKDGADADLTQEPEMIKAFRDTWELGIHSYLTYLRDRLLLAKELLHQSGSVFVQISDENLRHVAEIMAEVFGAQNQISIITIQKTSGATSELLSNTADYLVWYARDKSAVKYRQLFVSKDLNGPGGGEYQFVMDAEGRTRRLLTNERSDFAKSGDLGRVFASHPITSQRPPGDFPIEFMGDTIRPKSGYWKTGETGFKRLIKADRVIPAGSIVKYRRFFDDFKVMPYSNLWDDVSSGASSNDPKVYVVQTTPRIIERCLLMSTDPGDLVLDPTCGSGTTAVVAEKWGRRWITCDTSRVAIALAKQRLMTASYDYYALRYPQEGLGGGFAYETVPHIMLKSIANNPDIDTIYERMHPAVASALAALNTSLGAVPAFTPTQGSRKGKPIAFEKGEVLEEWEVPLDFQNGWPDNARVHFDTFHSARRAMLTAIDSSIKDHAEPEALYDKPLIDKTRLRVTGPFSLEAVPAPTVLSLDEAAPTEADATVARSGETARQVQWRDELLKTGIRARGRAHFKFVEMEPLPSLRHVHASGALDTGERVVVSFGPEHAALEQKQVERAIEEAQTLVPKPKFVVFCAFTFDPEAAKDIDETSWAGVTLLKAQMNTDLLTEDLKKARASNQSFWLMGQPDVGPPEKLSDGRWKVEVRGFDYFDPRSGELISGGRAKIAMWALDTDYDGRSLMPHQVFFPAAGTKDGWNRLRKTIRAELDEELLEQFHGVVSLPFDAGDNKRIAVKIVDDRGIESLKIMPLE